MLNMVLELIRRNGGKSVWVADGGNDNRSLAHKVATKILFMFACDGRAGSPNLQNGIIAYKSYEYNE